MSWYGRFAPYVSVAERRRKAAKEMEKLKKKGQAFQPVILPGRTIANTFWGKAWCENLEFYSDYSNRLPRGRTYVRNGSVLDLKVAQGEIMALVSGSSIYKVKISITKVVTGKWNKIVKECTGKIDSLIELLQGKFSKAIMEVITHPEKGLFPHPKEIKLSCSCPDWADMCKHVAAVLYGVGARLDDKPEELFTLRQADHVQLVAKAGATALTKNTAGQSDQLLEGSDLSSLFGIDMGGESQTRSLPKNKVSKIKMRKIIKENKKIKVKKTRLIKVKVAKKTVNKKSVVGVKKVKRKAKVRKPLPKKIAKRRR